MHTHIRPPLAGLALAIAAVLACGSSEEGTDTDAGTSGETSTGESTGTTGDNAAPEAADDFFFTRVGQPQTLAAADGLLANDLDPDADPLTVVDPPTSSEAGADLAIAGDGGLTYQPAAGFCGLDQFSYVASDANGGEATAEAVVTVHPERHTISQLVAECGGFTISGAAVGDHTGEAVTGIGDFDGDGLDDLAVASPVAHTIHIVFGTRRPRALDLANLAEGSSQTIHFDPGLDRRHLALAPAGDFNGDGLYDLAIAMPEVTTAVEGGGRVWVVFGRAEPQAIDLGTLVADAAGVEISGTAVDTRLGSGIDRAGDIDGDGRDDLLIGARLHGPMMSGTAHVIFGQDSAIAVDLPAMGDGTTGQSIHTAEAGAGLGWSVAGGRDINGDGHPDMVVGAPSSAANGSNSGRVYVVFGDPGRAQFDVDNLQAGDGYAIAGEAESDGAGYRVGLLDDLNGDGLAEVLVGAPFTAEQGWGSGSAYVVFGQTEATPIALSDITAGMGGFKITGEGIQAFAGEHLAGLGDLTGDGLPDLVVGAHGSEPLGFESGRAYLVAGRASAGEPIAFEDLQQAVHGQALAGPTGGSLMGISVAHAGDVNGDGFSDLIVGSPEVGVEPFGGGPPEGVGTGTAYVVFAGPPT